MRIVLKKVKRCVAVCLCVALFMTTNQVASAQENEGRDIMQEYLEKVAAGVEIYLLEDEEGIVFGYYEPYNKDDVVMPRYTSNIEWTAEPQHYKVGNNVYTLGIGSEIYVSISASTDGTSYLGLYERTEGLLHLLGNSKSTSGWYGKITLSTLNYSRSDKSLSVHRFFDITKQNA